MSLKQRIADDMKTAMREKDSIRLEAVRMLRAAIQRKEVDDQIELNDADVLLVVQKMVKQSHESIKQFAAGERQDLVDKEENSLQYIQVYMPEPLSDDAVAEFIQAAITETAASSGSDMGKVMAWLKPKLNGQADMGKVSKLVKDSLSA
ncbi:MAG: GatB/YqeY domain-containing protein [Arenicellales bacterium]